MRVLVLLIVLLVAVAVPVSSQAFTHINSVEPASGKVGDLLTIRGANLGKDNVLALYLTDGKNDFKAAILQQAGDSIQFRIPEAKPGKFSLMVLAGKGAEQRLIELPVRVTVEDPKERTTS